VLPHWLRVKVTVEDTRLSLRVGRVLEHRRLLDMRQGALFRQWRQQDPSGRITRLTYVQLASLADRHVILQSMAVTAENYVGRITLANHLAPCDASTTDVAVTVAELTAMLMRVSQVEVAIATASEFQTSVAQRTVNRARAQGDEELWSWEANLGETVRLDRIITVFSSREVLNPAKTASDHIASTRERGLSTAVRAHVDAWRRRWDAAGVRIAGDEEAQRALRFASYHLIAATNPADEHVSIGARGLTGEAYRGHVFWDTEIYILPFYIFTDPPAARSLLMYRYHTLGAARRKAKAFAWESADKGEETTPRSRVAPDGRLLDILTGEYEHHISADIAYAVWHYWRRRFHDLSRRRDSRRNGAFLGEPRANRAGWSRPHTASDWS
jgi:trehalose/maltose hydrolase-like predicted phosphorylase